MSFKGIDVSHHNGIIDWNTVKSQVDFVILKLGNMGDNKKFWTDTSFERNYNECKRLGIPVGVYVYCYTNKIDNAKMAAQEVNEYLKNKPIELPVYIDMEDDEIKVEGKDRLTQIIIEFNSEIERGGHWAGVYANLDWFNNYLHKDILKSKYTCWIAHIEYAHQQDKYEGQYDVFQYSWKGHVDGITGNYGKVDMNIMYRDLMSEIKGVQPSNPQPNPERKSNEEIAKEVWDGLWGNDEDRKNRITAAGYDYEAIRTIVNSMNKQSIEYYPKCNSSEKSIVDALNNIGVNSSKENRKKIASKNGINNYNGSSSQNITLLNKLKEGKLIK